MLGNMGVLWLADGHFCDQVDENRAGRDGEDMC